MRGAQAYLEHGLASAPKKVLAATGNYRKESDVLGEWLAACCELHPSAEATAASLFEHHKAWCLAQAKAHASPNALGRKLTNLDVGTRHTSRGNVRTGIRLRVETAEDLPPNVVEFFRSSTRPEAAPELDDAGIDHDAILATLEDD